MLSNFLATPRVKFLAFTLLALMGVFEARLFYLQVIRHSYYVALATQEQRKQLVLTAERGEIYMTDGNKPVRVVLNQTVYLVYADPVIVKEAERVAGVIRKIAGGNARPNLDKLLLKNDSRYQILATKVTREQAEMIKKEDLAGVGFQKSTQRVYPEGQLAAQVLGFVDADGKGRYGIEGGLNERLDGKDGVLKTVTDVRNVPLTIGKDNVRIPAKNGKNIVLTIDRQVQYYAEKALAKGLERTGAKKGSVVVIDPQNGRVLAMANLPTYNPGEYGRVEDASFFNNATISLPLEPGSNIKTFTMAAGIDKGVVGPSSTYNNTDYIRVEDRTISNLTKGQTGTITFQRALDYSLNTGFVTIAQRLGDGRNISDKARRTMYDYFYNRFRLGQLTGIELANEARGTIISPDDPDGGAVRYSNMAFGQGLDVTMLQAAAGFGAVVNGGRYYQPTVIGGKVGDDGQYIPVGPRGSYPGVVSPETSQTVSNMIIATRRAFDKSIDKPGYRIGGKTGTAQVVERGRYADDETIGTYLGFGGDERPRYVIMVQVSGPKMELQGGRDAMPIFTDISSWLIDYLQLQPSAEIMG